MGRDKAALTFDGQPLWQRQLATLRALEPAELLISGPLEGPWAGAGVEVVSDDCPGLGPMGGVATVLPRMRCERLLVLAVDLPAMTADFLRTLLAHATPDCGVAPMLDGRYEPLAAIYPRAIHALAARCVAGGDRSMQRFIGAGLTEGLLRAQPVAVADRGLFHNVNGPDDLPGGA